MIFASASNSPWFWAFLAGMAVWILREILGTAIKRAIARTGKIGFEGGRCGFFCVAKREDGSSSMASFHPDHLFLDRRAIELLVDGELYNDTDTQLLLSKPRVRFIGPTGQGMHYRNPEMLVDGKAAFTVAVPAHGKVALRLLMTIVRDELSKTYKHTIPILDLDTPNGKTLSFRLAATSFYGDPIAVWPRNGDRPVLLEQRADDETIRFLKTLEERPDASPTND